MAEVVYGSSPYAPHRADPGVASRSSMRKALAGFRDTYLVPNNATLLMVGKLPARDAADEDRSRRSSASWQQKTLPAAPKMDCPRPEAPDRAGGPARLGAGRHPRRPAGARRALSAGVSSR